MFDIDLLIAFFLMSVLFLRQIVILKQPNKIDYAPLVLGIGAISSIIHFILHPENSNLVLLFRESFIPILVAFILYLIMNILHQTQASMSAKAQEAFTQTVAYELSQLQEFLLELENRMEHTQEMSKKSHDDIREKFLKDIQILDTVLENQNKFLYRFKDVEKWHQDVHEAFKYFSEVQLPELDNVVHKHIDILRIAEQDHYNKLSTLLEKAVESRYDIVEDIEEVKRNVEKIGTLSDTIADNIVEKTTHKITHVMKAFESEIVLLKSHTEALKTSLYEGENTLSNIKIQSEMIMKQMVLSSKKMEELSSQKEKIETIFSRVESLLLEIKEIEADYTKAQFSLQEMLAEIEKTKTQEMTHIKHTVDELSETLAKKVDESLENLHEHYHITSEDISQSVKILAKKAQLQKGYGES